MIHQPTVGPRHDRRLRFAAAVVAGLLVVVLGTSFKAQAQTSDGRGLAAKPRPLSAEQRAAGKLDLSGSAGLFAGSTSWTAYTVSARVNRHRPYCLCSPKIADTDLTGWLVPTGGGAPSPSVTSASSCAVSAAHAAAARTLNSSSVRRPCPHAC